MACCCSGCASGLFDNHFLLQRQDCGHCHVYVSACLNPAEFAASSGNTVLKLEPPWSHGPTHASFFFGMCLYLCPEVGTLVQTYHDDHSGVYVQNRLGASTGRCVPFGRLRCVPDAGTRSHRGLGLGRKLFCHASQATAQSRTWTLGGCCVGTSPRTLRASR